MLERLSYLYVVPRHLIWALASSFLLRPFNALGAFVRNVLPTTLRAALGTRLLKVSLPSWLVGGR